MANPILSQIEIGGIVYDLRDLHAQGAMHFIGKTDSTAIKEGQNFREIDFTTSDGNVFFFGAEPMITGKTPIMLKQGDVVFVGKKEYAVVVTTIKVGQVDMPACAFVEFGSIGGKVEGVPTSGHTHTYKKSSLSHSAHKHSYKKSSLSHAEHNHSVAISYTPAGSVSNGTPTKGDFVTGVTPTRRYLAAQLITPVNGTGKAITALNTTTVPNVTNVGSAPTLGTAFRIPNVTNVGSAPTLGTNIAGVNASVTGTKLVLSAISIPNVTSVGSAPTLGTAFTVPNVTNVGSAPTLGTAITVATSAKTTVDFAKAGTATYVATGEIVDSLSNDYMTERNFDELDCGFISEISAPTGKAVTAESAKTFTGTAKNVSGNTGNTTVAAHTESDADTTETTVAAHTESDATSGAPSATGDFAVVG